MNDRSTSTDDDDVLPLGVWIAGGAIGFVGIALLGWRLGPAPAILAAAAIALVVVVSKIFRAVQILATAEGSLDDDVALAAPSPAQERKRTALRALKDLEFERTLGNVSDADYADLLARYRDEAKDAMRAVDEERAARRAAAEKLAARALARNADADSREDVVATHPEHSDTEEGEDSSDEKACPACNVKNDADARFCKACAAKLG